MESTAGCSEFAARQLMSKTEMSGYLVGSAAFKAVGTGDPRPAGSIPVHLRQSSPGHGAFLIVRLAPWSREAVVVGFLGGTRCSGLTGALIGLDRSPTQQCDVIASSASSGNVLTVDVVTRLGSLRAAGTCDYLALHLGRSAAQ